MPFREAYKLCGTRLQGRDPSRPTEAFTTHFEGSIGNLCIDKIEAMMDR
jgi:hypothetical protein